MNNEGLESYIRQKLIELDKQKDMQNVIYKGELSFGVDSTTYSHLPSWKDLVKQKKGLVTLVWVEAFFVSLMVILITGDFFESPEISWWKAALKLLIRTTIAMLFYVVWSYYRLFSKFRQTEREVRKLIYQDMLFHLKKEEQPA